MTISTETVQIQGRDLTRFIISWHSPGDAGTVAKTTTLISHLFSPADDDLRQAYALENLAKQAQSMLSSYHGPG